MARQSKHVRFQVAHKAAQMMAEEGISDYAFAKRKAAKFFGLIDGDALPSNDEINDAIKEHQAIFFDEKHASNLKMLRLEALNLMKKLIDFNPYLTGGLLDGTTGKFPIINIELYTESMKQVEFFLINHNISYKTRDLKKKSMLNKIPVFTIEGVAASIELIIYNENVLNLNKNKASIKEVEKIITLK